MITLEQIRAGAISVPAIRGVYFLLLEGAVVYIGQTPNMFRRIGEHLKTKQVDSYYFVPCTGNAQALTELERKLIDQFDPPLNRHKKFWQNIEEAGGHQGPATTRALALVAKGHTPYASAKKVGISLSTIYRALKRQRSV